MRLAIVCRESPGAVDAIRDHSLLLAAALRAEGHEVDVHLRRPDGDWLVEPAGRTREKLSDGLAGYAAVVVQYNPFLYGRRGFAPWLPMEIVRVRRQRDRPQVVLMVHEPFVPMTSWRWMLMGLWQRAQLAAARACADVVLVSIEAWTTRLGAWLPTRPTAHLPVGSNLPDMRAARGGERSRLGVDEDTLVVATIDTGGGTRSGAATAAALEALAGSHAAVLVLALGAGAPAPPAPAALRVERPGRLEPDELAQHLAAADIFLAPFVDGVSTRRGSLMAALQHGVAVVGTIGFLTDSALDEAVDAIRLVPVARPDLFAAEVVALADRPAARSELGRAGRLLYERTFDWPLVAAGLLAVIR